jgi:hypothetical protein
MQEGAGERGTSVPGCQRENHLVGDNGDSATRLRERLALPRNRGPVQVTCTSTPHRSRHQSLRCRRSQTLEVVLRL